jgi:uncharacterized protein (DUF1330 family)
MAAYLFVTIKIRDPSWVAEYQANVPAIMRKHGGEYFAVSENIKRYEGDGPDPDAIVLFTFPSMEAIDAFVSDADYGPYRTARRAASSGNLFAFTPRG